MNRKPKVEKAVINLESYPEGRHIMCCWDECENDGVDLHQVRVNYGTAAAPYVTKYVFCTERHKMFWVNSHRDYGKLPAGMKRSYL